MKNFMLIPIFFLLVSSVGAQIIVNIPAAADNTIYENPSGSSNALGQNIFSGTNGTNSPRRGLIKFDVAAAVPSNAVITSVMLTLNCNLSRAVADNVSLHKLASDWGEGSSNAGSNGDGAGVPATANDATWTTRFFPGTPWTNAGGDYNATPSATISINNTGFYQWSSSALLADVQSWLTAPASNLGWIIICNEITASTARKFGSRENATIANRPSLSVTYTTTLPVTLTYFKASEKNNRVLLSWETSQEINNHFFEVLHSEDGIWFSSIGKLNGYGTTSIKQEYQFTHETNSPGDHFYKLAQVNFDGRRTFTQTVRVHSTDIAGSLKIVPNPVLNEFAIYANSNLQMTSYSVFNICGAMLLTGVPGSATIKASGLKPGIYYLCLYKNEKPVAKMMFNKM